MCCQLKFIMFIRMKMIANTVRFWSHFVIKNDFHFEQPVTQLLHQNLHPSPTHSDLQSWNTRQCHYHFDHPSKFFMFDPILIIPQVTKFCPLFMRLCHTIAIFVVFLPILPLILCHAFILLCLTPTLRFC